MEEIWKDIEGYDGEYQVSNLGRIKSVARLTTRPCQYGIREYRIPEKILRTRLGTSGYLCVNLHHEGKQVTEMIQLQLTVQQEEKYMAVQVQII